MCRTYLKCLNICYNKKDIFYKRVETNKIESMVD